MFANYTSAAMSEESGRDGEKLNQEKEVTITVKGIQDIPLHDIVKNNDTSEEKVSNFFMRSPTVILFYKQELERLLRISSGDPDSLFMYMSNDSIHTQFSCDKKGNLLLSLRVASMAVQLTHELELTTEDKIAMLQAINKDNNRIKSLMETEKTREYTTESLKPYYDAIRSKELKNGIEWQYVKDGKVIDTAFMSYKELYEIQIGKNSTKCRFCESTQTRKYQPTYEDEAIWLCEQHEKYIQRVSQRIHGKAEEV